MVERRLIAVEGMVQGVGFRPFVHGLASALELRGTVRNAPAGVLVDVEGEASAIESFLKRLTTDSPPLAAIHGVEVREAPLAAQRGFTVATSAMGGPRGTNIPPDVATCDACVAELADPADRRYRYPFITCAHCGPRFTIITDLPYDRPRTTMASFAMCDACRAEYENPRDRRFHAQAIACWQCGPSLHLSGAGSREHDGGGERALSAAIAALREGRIVAVKGLGGYHLACDASSANAVARLRARKQREAKPFAIMVRDLQAVREVCEVSELEAMLLESAPRPIVLLARRAGTRGVADDVAPSLRQLGMMLPYTPLHHLLLNGLDVPLVLTSGNPHDEPIAIDDGDARARLAGIADVFLSHDRPIAVRCDDSVARVARGAPAILRRSRGLAPQPICLPLALDAPTLAVGGHLKNTFCIGGGRRAWPSQHIGDLAHADASRALRDGIGHFIGLLGIRPRVIAHDLHPDYRSTRIAELLAPELGAQLVAVQHHHAHVAACMAEHGVTAPTIGVVVDGAGLGTDGAIWGGEFLLVELDGNPRCERLGSLAYVPLPGGDVAAREPWRSACAHVWAAHGGDATALERYAAHSTTPPLNGARRRAIAQMMQRGVSSPPTSSVGRLFDAAASLTGVRHVSRFEGEAAMELEAIADRSTTRSYPIEHRASHERWILDPAPIVRGIMDDVELGRPASQIAGAFHNAMRDLVVSGAEAARRATGVGRVALTGGVFQNALLAERSADALTALGFEVLLHRAVPCNDGGIALGQLVIAGRSLSAREAQCA
ncbi:MAG: carbamoyltransferase HypF [Gemmatimonadaceae bacterium]